MALPKDMDNANDYKKLIETLSARVNAEKDPFARWVRAWALLGEIVAVWS